MVIFTRSPDKAVELFSSSDMDQILYDPIQEVLKHGNNDGSSYNLYQVLTRCDLRYTADGKDVVPDVRTIRDEIETNPVWQNEVVVRKLAQNVLAAAVEAAAEATAQRQRQLQQQQQNEPPQRSSSGVGVPMSQILLRHLNNATTATTNDDDDGLDDDDEFDDDDSDDDDTSGFAVHYEVLLQVDTSCSMEIFRAHYHSPICNIVVKETSKEMARIRREQQQQQQQP